MKIAIVGTGINGLSTAYYLLKLVPNVSITLYDKNAYIGGYMQSNVYQVKDKSYFFEYAPRSLQRRSNTMFAYSLIKELKIDKNIIQSDKSSSKTYLFLDNKWKLINSSLIGLYNLRHAIFGGLKNVLNGYHQGYNKNNLDVDISIADFFNSRLNGETVKILDCLVAGIYAGDVKKLSINSLFPNFPTYEATSDTNSFVKEFVKSFKQPTNTDIDKDILIDELYNHKDATELYEKLIPNSVFSFEGGLKKLPTSIYDSLSKDSRVQFQLNSPIDRIKINDKAAFIQSNGKNDQFDCVAWTGDTLSLANSLASIPTGSTSILDQITSQLTTFEYADVAVVNLAYDKPLIKPENFGFGILVNSEEKVAKNGLLGITFDSCCFPKFNNNPNETRLTVMLGGARAKVEKGSEAYWMKEAIKSVKEVLNIDVEPDFKNIWLAKTSIPQHNVNHNNNLKSLLKDIDETCKGRLILGGMLHGISVPAGVKTGGKSAVKISNWIKSL